MMIIIMVMTMKQIEDIMIMPASYCPFLLNFDALSSISDVFI